MGFSFLIRLTKKILTFLSVFISFCSAGFFYDVKYSLTELKDLRDVSNKFKFLKKDSIISNHKNLELCDEKFIFVDAFLKYDANSFNLLVEYEIKKKDNIDKIEFAFSNKILLLNFNANSQPIFIDEKKIGFNIKNLNSNSLIFNASFTILPQYFPFEKRKNNLKYALLWNFLPDIRINDSILSDFNVSLKIQLNDSVKIISNSYNYKVQENNNLFKLSFDTYPLVLIFNPSLYKIIALKNSASFLIAPKVNEKTITILQELIDSVSSFLSQHFNIKEPVEVYFFEVKEGATYENEFIENVVFFSNPTFEPKDAYGFYYNVARTIIYNSLTKIKNKRNKRIELELKGISSFLTIDYLKKNTPKKKLYFRVKKFYLPGLKFISFENIPLVYSIGNYYFDPDRLANEIYLYNPTSSGILSTSDAIENDYNYEISFFRKPELLLRTIEVIIGRDSLNKVLLNYIKNQNNLFLLNEETLTKIAGEKYRNFISEVLYTSKKYDYKLASVLKLNDTIYRVTILKLEDGNFPAEIFFITENDTIKKEINESSAYQTIDFVVKTKPIRVEIDPKKKNYFELNYADNSYMLENNYLAIYALSINWFFWMQNLFVILGSAA